MKLLVLALNGLEWNELQRWVWCCLYSTLNRLELGYFTSKEPLKTKVDSTRAQTSLRSFEATPHTCPSRDAPPQTRRPLITALQPGCEGTAVDRRAASSHVLSQARYQRQHSTRLRARPVRREDGRRRHRTRRTSGTRREEDRLRDVERRRAGAGRPGLRHGPGQAAAPPAQGAGGGAAGRRRAQDHHCSRGRDDPLVRGGVLDEVRRRGVRRGLRPERPGAQPRDRGAPRPSRV